MLIRLLFQFPQSDCDRYQTERLSMCRRKEPGIDAAKRVRTWTAYKKAARKAAARPAPRNGSSIPAPDEPLELVALVEEPVEEPEPEPLEPEADESLVVVAERVAVDTVPLVLEEPEPVPAAKPPEGMAMRVDAPDGMATGTGAPDGMVVGTDASDDGGPAGTVAATGCVVTADG